MQPADGRAAASRGGTSAQGPLFQTADHSNPWIRPAESLLTHPSSRPSIQRDAARPTGAGNAGESPDGSMMADAEPYTKMACFEGIRANKAKRVL